MCDDSVKPKVTGSQAGFLVGSLGQVANQPVKYPRARMLTKTWEKNFPTCPFLCHSPGVFHI